MKWRIISLTLLGMALGAVAAFAANNANLSGVSQGWIIGNTSSTVLNPLQGGSIRKQIIIQSDPQNPLGSYVCIAFGSPSQGTPCTAVCTTAGGDNGGIKISPGGSAEWPRDTGGGGLPPAPQGDVCIACTTTGCNVTVFQQ